MVIAPLPNIYADDTSDVLAPLRDDVITSSHKC